MLAKLLMHWQLLTIIEEGLVYKCLKPTACFSLRNLQCVEAIKRLTKQATINQIVNVMNVCHATNGFIHIHQHTKHERDVV